MCKEKAFYIYSSRWCFPQLLVPQNKCGVIVNMHYCSIILALKTKQNDLKTTTTKLKRIYWSQSFDIISFASILISYSLTALPHERRIDWPWSNSLTWNFIGMSALSCLIMLRNFLSLISFSYCQYCSDSMSGTSPSGHRRSSV